MRASRRTNNVRGNSVSLLFLLLLAVVVLIAWGVAVLLSRAASSVYDRVTQSSTSAHRVENSNANNPDALEADLDPEGDEPQGY
jgi:predicted PurR-regulated permease PerM